VLITPHSSSSTEATADRRWSVVAANLDRFARGETLENIVLQTLIAGRRKLVPESLLEESGFEPLVPLATEMLTELARGISKQLGCWRSATWGGAAVLSIRKWDQRFESAFLQRGVSSEPREHTAAEGIQYDGLGVLPGTTPAARGGREPLIVIKSRLQTRWLATRLADGSHDGL
jgi:hypothetical protein